MTPVRTRLPAAGLAIVLATSIIVGACSKDPVCAGTLAAPSGGKSASPAPAPKPASNNPPPRQAPSPPPTAARKGPDPQAYQPPVPNASVKPETNARPVTPPPTAATKEGVKLNPLPPPPPAYKAPVRARPDVTAPGPVVVVERLYPAPAVVYVDRPRGGDYLGNPGDPGNPYNRWNLNSPYYWAFWSDDRDDRAYMEGVAAGCRAAREGEERHG